MPKPLSLDPLRRNAEASGRPVQEHHAVLHSRHQQSIFLLAKSLSISLRQNQRVKGYANAGLMICVVEL